MKEIDAAMVSRIFRTEGGVEPTDISGRTKIFQATARELLTLYDGDFLKLLALCGNRISGKDGFLERVSGLSAYSDPVAKKANLVCKLLFRDGLFEALDRDEIEIAVDHVVMTMGLRSGAITCEDPRILHQLHNGIKIDEYVLQKLRELTKSVYRSVSEFAQLHPDEVDDLIWSYGRKALRQPTPLPNGDVVESELDERVEYLAKIKFIEFMNGIDSGGVGDVGEYTDGSGTIYAVFLI